VFTATVTPYNAVELADRINAGYDAGTLTTVNGHALASRNGLHRVAKSWGNGTVSVTVRGRNARYNEVYVKAGRTLTAG
jgi:hypothetical protein